MHISRNHLLQTAQHKEADTLLMKQYITGTLGLVGTQGLWLLPPCDSLPLSRPSESS